MSTTAWADDWSAARDRFTARYDARFDGARLVQGEVPGCGEVWYLDSPHLLSPATGPLVLDHGERRAEAVVLVHGLSDSPFFLCAVARALFDAGANVVMPLLTGHGRREPWPEVHAPQMAYLWQADADAALDLALARGDRVSVGGFSTGGLLATWLWTQRPEDIAGGILLFSAAFDFAAHLRLAAGCAGTDAERSVSWLRRWCYDVLVRRVQAAEAAGPWTSANPYRIRFSNYQALHLGLLRRETLQALAVRRLTAPLLVVHSVADATAPIAGVDWLVRGQGRPERVRRVTLDDTRRTNCRVRLSDCTTPAPAAAACGIGHTSVVLASPIRAADGAVCEPANPRFDEVARAAVAFLRDLPSTTAP